MKYYIIFLERRVIFASKTRFFSYLPHVANRPIDRFSIGDAPALGDKSNTRSFEFRRVTNRSRKPRFQPRHALISCDRFSTRARNAESSLVLGTSFPSDFPSRCFFVFYFLRESHPANINPTQGLGWKSERFLSHFLIALPLLHGNSDGA